MIGLNRRRVMGGKSGLLPHGYTQVEYIESTGTQYIDTGILVNPLTDGYDYNIKFINDLGGTRTIAGLWEGSFDTSHICFSIGGNFLSSYYSYNLNFRGGNSNVSLGAMGIVNSFNHISLINNGYDNGNVVLTETTPLHGTRIRTFGNPYMYVSKLTFVLFAMHNPRGISEHSHCQCKWFTLLRLGTPILNLIPCISPTNVVGMYDTVEGRFYSSPNGAAFIAGNPV